MIKSYQWVKGLKKGLVAAAAVGAGLVAGAEAMGSLGAVQEVSTVAFVSAAVAAVRVGMNWWKVNRDLADRRYVR